MKFNLTAADFSVFDSFGHIDTWYRLMARAAVSVSRALLSSSKKITSEFSLATQTDPVYIFNIFWRDLTHVIWLFSGCLSSHVSFNTRATAAPSYLHDHTHYTDHVI